MQKKYRFPLRALCAVLSLCLAAAMAAPVASALTPQQAQRLQTGQRSLNNPGGGFTAPGAVPGSRFLHPDTFYAGQLLASNVLNQVVTANADPEEWRRILSYAPIIREGDELPPRGDAELKNIPQFLLQRGMRDMYVALQETDTPDVYRIVTFFSTRAGETYWVPQGTLYDFSTGELYGEDGAGILGLGYDYNSSKQIITCARNSWQRALGFNIFMDAIGPLVTFRFETFRFPFAYDGKDWQIQVWKGSYWIVSNGAEIGLYEKPSGRPVFWDCSDTYLDMSMRLYQGSDTLLFDYPAYNTWWLGGFRYGNPRILPVVTADKLRLTGTILFKDQAMLDAFLVSFEENRPANMTGGADGLLFRFDWQAG